MLINKELKAQLKENCIDVNEGLTVILILYFGLEKGNTMMNDKIITLLSVAQIIDYDYEKEEYIFNIPVFEEEPVKAVEENPMFDVSFIKEYISVFVQCNPQKRVSVASVLPKMKMLVKNYPDVTQQELIAAAKLHVTRFDRQHIKQPNYFIHKEGEGFNCMTEIEMVREGHTADKTDANPFEDVL